MNWLFTAILSGRLLTVQQDASPIQEYLETKGATSSRAASVAQRIVQQSKKWNVDAHLITAIVTVENPLLTSKARSAKGAVGVMQVMPFWKRSFARVCGSNLQDDATNICYGIQVLKAHMKETKGNMNRALLSYSGCSNRLRCGRYSQIVLARQKHIGTIALATDKD